MTDNLFIPKPKDVIKMGPWFGVVLDVFTSETTGQHIVRIQFAKNVFKQQKPELHILEEDTTPKVEPATTQQLNDEMVRYEKQARSEASHLLTKASKTQTAEAYQPVHA